MIMMFFRIIPILLQNATVKLNIRKSTGLMIEVANMMGQTVITVDAGFVKPGMKEVELMFLP